MQPASGEPDRAVSRFGDERRRNVFVIASSDILDDVEARPSASAESHLTIAV
jgi:hypothetical protein